jgi:hypothetical protein
MYLSRPLMFTDCARFSGSEAAGRWTKPAGTAVTYSVQSGTRTMDVCVGAVSRVAWLDVSADHPRSSGVKQQPISFLGSEYPALYELVQRLSGVPFELNRKLSRLRLARPLPGLAQLREISVEVWASVAQARGETGEGTATHIDVGMLPLRRLELLPLGPSFRLDDAQTVSRQQADKAVPTELSENSNSGSGAGIAVDNVGVKLACVAAVGGKQTDLQALPEGDPADGPYIRGALLVDARESCDAVLRVPHKSVLRSCSVNLEIAAPLQLGLLSDATATQHALLRTAAISALDNTSPTGIDDGCILYRVAASPTRWRVLVQVDDSEIAVALSTVNHERSTSAPSTQEQERSAPIVPSESTPMSEVGRALTGKRLIARYTSWTVAHWFHGHSPTHF